MLLMADTDVPRVAVVNESTKVSNASVYNWVKGLQFQVHNHFAPLWGVDAVVVATLRAGIKPYNWVLAILDNSDQADALGYHDLTAAGQPIMKAFVDDSNTAGVPVSSVASHELLETLADPWMESLELQDNGNGTGRLYMQEVCDPVEGDSYNIWGVAVSNFVTPWWFGQISSSRKYDFLDKLTAAFTMTPGGYFGYRDITSTGLGAWEQSFADERSRVISKLSRAAKRIQTAWSTAV